MTKPNSRPPNFRVTLALALHMRRRDFDLLISDLGPPDRSGFDLMAEVRQLRPDLPAIALSGCGQEQDVRRSQEAGFATHLTKPVDHRRLEQAIEAAAT